MKLLVNPKDRIRFLGAIGRTLHYNKCMRVINSLVQQVWEVNNAVPVDILTMAQLYEETGHPEYAKTTVELCRTYLNESELA